MDNTIKSNTMIAKFMTATFDEHNRLRFITPPVENALGYYEPRELKYNKSWNWLMPVVEKISRIKIDWENAIPEYDDRYYLRTFGMLNAETGNIMVRINGNPLFEAETLMEATYKAVVSFVQFYNKS